MKNKAGDPGENELLIQKLEPERTGELLASPPSALWPLFCSHRRTPSRSGLLGRLGWGNLEEAGPDSLRSQEPEFLQAEHRQRCLSSRRAGGVASGRAED